MYQKKDSVPNGGNIGTSLSLHSIIFRTVKFELKLQFANANKVMIKITKRKYKKIGFKSTRAVLSRAHVIIPVGKSHLNYQVNLIGYVAPHCYSGQSKNQLPFPPCSSPLPVESHARKAVSGEIPWHPTWTINHPYWSLMTRVSMSVGSVPACVRQGHVTIQRNPSL